MSRLDVSGSQSDNSDDDEMISMASENSTDEEQEFDNPTPVCEVFKNIGCVKGVPLKFHTNRGVWKILLKF